MISLCTQIAKHVTKLLPEDVADDIPMTTLNTVCTYFPHHMPRQPLKLYVLCFLIDPKAKVFPNHLHCQWLCPGCAYPVEPPQARASARVLAKHVCQPKSCGCVVNVCCNWEIYIKILLGWCGGAKEGLRNVNLGCGIQLNATRHSFDGKDVFTIVHAQRFVSEEALGCWGCQVSLFVVISRRVGISPHPVAENHMFWALIVKWAVATFLCIGSDI